jgi:hypothetical protein
MAPKAVDRKGTQLLHGDDALRRGEDVAAAISVSTSAYRSSYVRPPTTYIFFLL